MPKGAAYLEENEAEKKHPSSDEKGIISPGEISEYIFHQLSITRYNRVSLSISSLCSMDPSISNCNFKNLWSGEPTLHHKSLFKKKESFLSRQNWAESSPFRIVKLKWCPLSIHGEERIRERAGNGKRTAEEDGRLGSSKIRGYRPNV